MNEQLIAVLSVCAFGLKLVGGLVFISCVLTALIVWVERMKNPTITIPILCKVEMGGYSFFLCADAETNNRNEQDPITYRIFIYDAQTRQPIKNLLWETTNREKVQRLFKKFIKDFNECAPWTIDLLQKKETEGAAQ